MSTNTGMEGLPDDVEHNNVRGSGKHPDSPKADVDTRPPHVQQVILENGKAPELKIKRSEKQENNSISKISQEGGRGDLLTTSIDKNLDPFIKNF